LYTPHVQLCLFFYQSAAVHSRPEIALFIFGDYRELRHLYEKLFVFIFSLSTEPCHEK
jgi:hypothetical protein